ncbi:dipeptide epimerase [Sphingomonas sp. DT-204]|uniref:dipeptide epimerase n=1 Tax=Sphingomonas sp. DT-204 TaxID=3396166 RepID=UPI003F1B94A2
MKVNAAHERWPLAVPFRITGRTYHESEVVVVELRDGDHVGRGEACGVDYRHDTVARMLSDIAAVTPAIEAGADRMALQALLPACGARNALDAAFWALEARRAGEPVWHRAGLAEPRPLLTTWTIGADVPAAMASRARDFAGAAALKLKLVGDDDDAARVTLVRESRPDVWLGVDANRGYDRPRLEALLPVLVEAGVALIEQPFAIGQEAEMAKLASPIATAADESVQDIGDLAAVAGLFDMVNIKLDKCGGLTRALAMAREARRLGLGVMVGNMVGTSLALAPAYLLGQVCDIVDLDGPLLLARDREPAATYAGGTVRCEDPLWCGPAA